jgi:hypothetical protein
MFLEQYHTRKNVGLSDSGATGRCREKDIGKRTRASIRLIKSTRHESINRATLGHACSMVRPTLYTRSGVWVQGSSHSLVAPALWDGHDVARIRQGQLAFHSCSSSWCAVAEPASQCSLSATPPARQSAVTDQAPGPAAIGLPQGSGKQGMSRSGLGGPGPGMLDRRTPQIPANRRGQCISRHPALDQGQTTLQDACAGHLRGRLRCVWMCRPNAGAGWAKHISVAVGVQLIGTCRGLAEDPISYVSATVSEPSSSEQSADLTGEPFKVEEFW